jgi:hypothetical protein
MSTANTLPIVRPEQVDAAWMTAALGRAGLPGRVVAVQGKRVGTGQVGLSVRFDLTWADAPADAPATVVGKFAAADPVSREAGIRFGNYVREVNFYRELAATALVATPRCLHADIDAGIDGASGEFVLLMEDLAPAVQGDQTVGLTLPQVVLALDEAAKLHASHWGDDALDATPWFFEGAAAPRTIDGAVVEGLWAGFRARYGDRVTADDVRIGDAIVRDFEKYKFGYRGPKCLTHNDFRPDNMMFGTPAGGRPVTVVDWQTLGYGCCMADVAYFLAGALPLEQRRANERALLQGYHARLCALGVTGYGFDALWRDYARYGFALFVMAFTASMVVERTPRGDEMFFAMLHDSAAMILDCDSIGVLRAE